MQSGWCHQKQYSPVCKVGTFSSRNEILQPLLSNEYNRNPGAIEAKQIDENDSPKQTKIGDLVRSVTIDELLSVTPSNSSTYIIKTDIQGYDCQAVDMEKLMKNRIYIPYIFMELFHNKNNSCQHLEKTMKQNGYKSL